MKKITALLFSLLLLINGLFGSSVPQAHATTATFSYTGAQQTWVVPAGVTSVTVDMYGAAGYGSGYGGRVQTTLAVTPGDTLYVYVGQNGIVSSTAAFNGGGAFGGGGASDIRQGGSVLGNRVIVAGGGGGQGWNAGGQGGGTTGGTGPFAAGRNQGGAGTGGTSSAGGTGGTGILGYGNGNNGSLGVGGDGAIGYQGASVKGGGGGGYYGGGGGGGGGNSTDGGPGGGGGGSSYAGTGTSATTHTQGYASATGNGQVSIAYTDLPPTITTPTQASIGSTTATLGGNVTDGGTDTVTGRGVCVGTSINPTTGCTSTTGTTGVFTVAVTGLSSSTLYHYRAYATNSVGTSYTTDDFFTTGTPAAPTVATSAETNVDSNSTTLNGTVNPNFAATDAWYLWGPSNVACASLPNSTASQSLGSGGSSVALTAALSGLSPGATYYYCAVAVNSLGITYSTVTSFTQTSASGCSSVGLTTDYTVSSSCVFGNSTNDGVDKGTGTQNDAVLTVAKGTTLTVGASQTVAYGTIYKPGATVVRLSGGSLRRGPVWVPDADGDGYPDSVGTQGQIIQATQPAGYARRAVVAGANKDCNSSDAAKFKNYVGFTDADADGYGATAVQQLFCSGATLTGATVTSSGVDCLDTNASYNTTCPPYNVSSTAASSVVATSAVLNSTINPNTYTTSITYRYQTTSTATCNASTPTSTLAGPTGLTGGSNLSGATTQQSLTGLSVETTYYFCATATNSYGTTYGSVLNFTTPCLVDIQTFNASGTWTKPACATNVTITCTGGGGGGSGAAGINPGLCSYTSAASGGGGGGGSGGYSSTTVAASTLNATETVTIGTGGSGGPGGGPALNGTVGSAGGNTTFKTVTANGGSGGNTSGGTCSCGNVGGGGGAGGTGSTNNGNTGTAGGATGGASGNCAGVTTGGAGGAGGAAPSGGGGGGGGTASASTGNAGTNGSAPGGGGGGGSGAFTSNSSNLSGGAGGNGGSGVCVITSQ